MDFIEVLQNISSKISKQKNLIQTEEATKNAFVLPFISALGYDVFDPAEVIPEFTADVGIKKGEKVDYAIKQDGKLILLFECKCCNGSLDESHASQLYRYFSVTEARMAVLTDGITYRFYTDIEEPNKMDAKPFMEFNMLDIQEPLVLELKRLTKQAFNLGAILTVASELKYTREIKRLLYDQLQAPSEDFVRFVVSQVYTGKITMSVREQFTGITKRAFAQLMNERIAERLRSAMGEADAPEETNGETDQPNDQQSVAVTPESVSKIVTTEDELQAYYIVKAVVCAVMDTERIVYRDTQNYFGVLCDDNNRKPICRLHFNGKQKYIGIINADKSEERIPIDNLNEIYQLADRLRATAGLYVKQ
ncbi:MAG: type I restriction enzyme HsdR N-terminal domain-containing protein [Ktedonobacteraceae bacterium]|nr:type I restriction enzyme HsdR N-terminal domain-containing protein [Ktedonobacteraceae bacterium]